MARILLAEDDDATRELIARALANAGHEVTSVADGAEALPRFVGKPFDLVLTDIVMPAMDGIELANHAGREQPGLGIILMTGYQDVAGDAEPMLPDGARILVKPFRLDDLFTAIDKLLAA